MANSISNQVVRERRPTNVLTTTQSISEGNSTKDYSIATDALVITLPTISTDNLGMEFTFRNTGADANNIITLSPASTDAFIGGFPFVTGSTASMNRASGVLDKNFINTKATSKKGDFVTLKAVAVGAWYIQGGQGVWVSEA